MITKELLQKEVDAKWINVQKHPTEELYIYNYSNSAQYNWYWNDVIRAARGLVLDASGNMVARPFPKFFSYEQLNGVVPNLPFEAYEKYDGSLLISYWVGDKVYFATRGSFSSDQSVWANLILRTKYPNLEESLDRDKTYLFELLSKNNRIVLDYGNIEDIVLLAIVNTATGEEISLPTEFPTPIAKKYDFTAFEDILKIDESGREGFVIKFSNQERCKIKFSEYKRLHRILTGVSSTSIWDLLRNNQPLDEIIERVPDEFYSFVKKTELDLKMQYKAIEEQARSEYRDGFPDRKSAALYFKNCAHPSILFALLDGKAYNDYIWKQIKPKWVKPFREDDE